MVSRGCPVNGKGTLSGYNAESLTLDHSGLNVCHITCMLKTAFVDLKIKRRYILAAKKG
jgi:hypothetical protein